MIPEKKKNSLSSLCILCHDVDRVLPFYRDILGFIPDRAEESFYSLTGPTGKANLCLWEIGHIARNSVFEEYSSKEIPSKYMISAAVPSVKDVDNIRTKVASTDVHILPSTAKVSDVKNLHFVDSSGVIWHIFVDETADRSISLDRITLVCQNLSESREFYEKKIKFCSYTSTKTQVVYSTDGDTQLALWDVASAAEELGLSRLLNQGSIWGGHTGMIALSYDTVEQMDAQFQLLQKRGVFFNEKPAHFQWDFTASYFCDPDQNIWELFTIPQNLEARMLQKTEEG